ncbi:P-type DNA transfer ATPase VirB11 [Phenylobacterium sp.]|uniref:P-type DNA transfer ATPase VirB11 n=1 Tax=Phenylobacterium sp. TaxID=1871053 RepID=UPI00273802DE|nr:P-type DNA transfer ATPase VirB11 [Phenylobacterium sp.]MDP3866774.1 P-type DNA transfer ATPase VirB11 [Phenylobacterium sp.]
MVQDSTVLQHYLQPLQGLLDPPDVTDLVINRPGEIAVEQAGHWRWFEAPDLTPAWLSTLAIAAAAFTAQDITPQTPICSTVLPRGERCQIVLPPAVEHLSMTIRRPAAVDLSLDDLAGRGLFEAVRRTSSEAEGQESELLALHGAGDWQSFLRLAVQAKRNILISGATGSGKTTLAKALVRLIPAEERLLTIEDTRELTTPQRNVVHLLYAKDGQGMAKVDATALLECALRMRPDRILLQELRDASAFTYLRSANSGHPGSITTVHADSAMLAFEQVALLIKESDGGRDMSRDEIGHLLRLLVDIVVQVRRVEGRFRVTEVWYEAVRRRPMVA